MAPDARIANGHHATSSEASTTTTVAAPAATVLAVERHGSGRMPGTASTALPSAARTATSVTTVAIAEPK